MFITLPLALIGVGFMNYLLFAAATYVLPLYAGVSAAFAALPAGASYESALLLGILAFLLVVMLGQMAAQLLPSRHLRVAIALLFALASGAAGFQVADALLQLGGMAAVVWRSRWRRRWPPVASLRSDTSVSTADDIQAGASDILNFGKTTARSILPGRLVPSRPAIVLAVALRLWVRLSLVAGMAEIVLEF